MNKFILWSALIIFSAIAQILFKKSVNFIDKGNFLDFIFNINIYYFIAAIVIIMIELFIWLKIINKSNLIEAFNYTALIYIAVMIFSNIFLNEKITMAKIIGTSLITIGVFVISI